MPRSRLNRISLLLLALGFGAALVIFLIAPPPSEDPLLGDPLNNKKYRRELQLIGGKANVLSAELQDWWAAQWEGRLLARSVAVLTVAGVLVFRFVATHPGAALAERKPPAGPPGAGG